MGKKRIAIIFNGSAGAQDGEALLQKITEICQEYELDTTPFVIHAGADISQIVKKALHEKFEVIVAAGGDGTISAVAGVLIGTSVLLGILPLGTRNHFAKDIQIPLDLKEAMAVISQGEVMALDIASVNGQFFVNNSSVGFYPKIVKFRELFQRKGFYRWIAFIFASAIVMNRNSFLRLRIASSKKDITSRTPLIFVGNNRYTMQGYELGSRDSLVRGKLFLSLMHRTSRLKLFQIAVQAILDLPSQNVDFDTWMDREMTIYAEKKFLRVSLDGEIRLMQTPLRYLIHPHAINVIVPQNYAYDRSHL